jgi:glucose/arabinose dehydrogenase
VQANENFRDLRNCGIITLANYHIITLVLNIWNDFLSGRVTLIYPPQKGNYMKSVRWSITLAVALLVLNSCKKDDDDKKPESPGTGKPVETKPANTTYPPAFTGQTRINGVKTSASYQGTVLTSSLTAPWGITSLPDGRLLITEKAGRLRIVTSTGAVGNAITGIPAVNAAGQGGLLGLCIDPQFSTNRILGIF